MTNARRENSGTVRASKAIPKRLGPLRFSMRLPISWRILEPPTGSPVAVRRSASRILTPLRASDWATCGTGAMTPTKQFQTLMSVQPQPRARRAGILAKALDEIGRDVTGAAILAEWLGAKGEPVTAHLAEKRAKICLNCPKNKPGNWWDRNVKDPIANAIRRHVGVKNKLGLTVEREALLGTCKVCGCNLPLAVWVPVVHILHQSPPEELAKFPGWCWKHFKL